MTNLIVQLNSRCGGEMCGENHAKRKGGKQRESSGPRDHTREEEEKEKTNLLGLRCSEAMTFVCPQRDR